MDKSKPGKFQSGIFIIMRKSDLSKEIKAHQGKDHDPDAEENMTAEHVQVIRLVNLAQEIKRKGQHNKGKEYLDGIKPAA